MINRLGCRSVLITGPDLNVSWLVLSPEQFSSVVFYGSDFYGCDCRRGLISCCNLGCTLAFSVELCGVLLAFLALNSQLFHRELDAKRAEDCGLTSICFGEAPERNLVYLSLQDKSLLCFHQ